MRRYTFQLNLIAALAALSGLVALSSTLAALAHFRMARIALADAHLTVIAGISLIYLATLLRRGKYNAWLISIPVYVYLLLRNYQHFVVDLHRRPRIIAALLNLLLPLLVLALLLIYRNSFKARSEIRSFTVALRRALLILVVAFLYGVIGFALMDEHDFHQEISLPSAAHYTVDQFGLTTNQQITAYTKRANLFLDSLGVVSVGAVFYAAVSFFAPIRFRLRHSQKDYDDARSAVEKHSLTSEDFFKLWPRDKAYFFSGDRKAVIAYKVTSNVALAVADPVGPKSHTKNLISEFMEYCWINDWAPAFIHTDKHNLRYYEALGLSSQKIGEEAMVDIKKFNERVATNKYFRNINNKFNKNGYSSELLSPPHSPEIIKRLRIISDEWLSVPGKTERTLMLGYFGEGYLQACNIMAARDQSGEIQAFLNQLPLSKRSEANFDMLRASSSAMTNTNDYLMLNFFNYLGKQGYERLNMGLSPLTGLDSADDKDRGAIDSLLHFVYDNADRFYSFQGLARFKSKYEPEWESRYIIYKGGVPGFTRTMNALIKGMRLK